MVSNPPAGHDSTIVPLLAALDIYKDIWPPYSSHILLELAQHKDKPEAHYVRVLYNDKEKLGVRPSACIYSTSK